MEYGKKPQRQVATSGWRQAALIVENARDAEHKSTAERVLFERALVTCRECYGYGHGLTKCPTSVRMKKFALVNKMGKHLFATYRTGSVNRHMTEEFPDFPIIKHVAVFY